MIYSWFLELQNLSGVVVLHLYYKVKSMKFQSYFINITICLLTAQLLHYFISYKFFSKVRLCRFTFGDTLLQLIFGAKYPHCHAVHSYQLYKHYNHLNWVLICNINSIHSEELLKNFPREILMTAQLNNLFWVSLEKRENNGQKIMERINNGNPYM